MEKIDKLKVTEHNDLIKSTIKMDLIPLKLFEMAASAVDPRKSPEENQTVRIRKADIFRLLGTNSNNKNQELTKALKKLRDQASFELRTVDEKGKPVDVGIKPVVATRNPHAGEYVEIEFYHDIMQYLTELKRDFTRYDLIDVAQMSSRYGISLYKILVAYYNQYEIYSKRNLRTHEQLREFSDPVIDVDELRKWTGTTNKYSHFYDCERYVLKKAVDDINKHSSLRVTYEKISWSRQVLRVQFHINRKDEVESDYKKYEKGDITAIITDRAGALLLGNGLLDLPSLQADDKMVTAVQNELLPAYHNFTKKYGYNELAKHLSYVASKLEVKPEHLVRYLLVALDGYQEQLKKPTPRVKSSTRRKKNGRSPIKEPKPKWMTDREKPAIASDETVNAIKTRLKQRKVNKN